MKQIREKRDREITFIHTGGQTGPRWRALLGKSGPKILVFSSLFNIRYFRYVRVFCFIPVNGTNKFDRHEQLLLLAPPFKLRRGTEQKREVKRTQIVFTLWTSSRNTRLSKLNRLYNLFLCSSVSQRRAARIISGGSGFQKLEDLVRLALKRLNVSYLTEYRHVWYGLRRGCSRVSVIEAKLNGRFR